MSPPPRTDGAVHAIDHTGKLRRRCPAMAARFRAPATAVPADVVHGIMIVMRDTAWR
jgi:hypothetical protein